MKIIRLSPELVSVTHLVIELADEPIKVDFGHVIDDVLISSPDGDILIAWDNGSVNNFDPKKSLLLSQRDNLKEFGNIKSNHIVIAQKQFNHGIYQVYLTIQFN